MTPEKKFRFDCLRPSIGPVVAGLEDHERIAALEQWQYAGADILVEVLHFGGPMAPTRVMLFDDHSLSDADRSALARCFRAQTKGPYEL